MNTPRDTDEGRARPSVWPVYVAAAVIGLVSLCLSIHFAVGLPLDPVAWGFLLLSAYRVSGPLGLLTAYGLVRLRVWGWVCALAWLWVFISSGFLVLVDAAFVAGSYMDDSPMFPADARGDAELVFSLGGPVWLITVVLLIWTLAMRRRLFFAPKPEREE